MTSAFEWEEAIPTIKYGDVELSRLTEGDVPALFEIFGHPEVMRYWSTPRLHDEAAAAALLNDIHEAFRTRQLFQWGVRIRGTAKVVGTCTLFNLDFAHRRAEIGFAVARREWRQGIATKATRALIEFAFERLDLHRLEADADPRNSASLRVLERHGFRREGHLRERYHQGGEIQDALILGLLRREWDGPAHEVGID
ncbi:MAG: GNAT family N-acetyltransferase [Deltaproteobacteria bacterium]|nr:GNAT family N-acetyltransferase [Deltaproteobacteria bacterium]